MYEHDYIMRLIKEIIRVILKLLLGIDTESPTTELLRHTEEAEVNHLLKMIDEGKINCAEKRVYQLIGEEGKEGLKKALLFYSYLNDKSDEFLEENGFSREEVMLGIERIADGLGIGEMVKTVLFLD